MTRREFIGAALGAVFTPFAVEAQQMRNLYRVGWLDYSSSAENLGIFLQAMGARGWLEGKTFRIEYRGGEGKTEQLLTVAAGVVGPPRDVILSAGTQEALAPPETTGF